MKSVVRFASQWGIAFFLLGACSRPENEEAVKPADECLTQASAANGRIIEGEYIVTYQTDGKEPVSAANARLEVRSRTSSLLARHRIAASAIRQDLTGYGNGFAGKLTPAEAEDLRRDPAVAHVEPDRILSISACFTVADTRRITWGVNRVGYGDGTGKTAWVIDTGIDLDHPDLNVDAARSQSYVSGKTPDDDNGHGTHVAGIIGAKNNRIGTLGVASNAQLVSLKVMDNVGEGRLSNVIAAVGHVYRNGKPGDVVNMSLGGDVSQTLDNEVTRAAQRGIFFAVAAGNDAKSAALGSPSRVNNANVYTVSAMDSTGAWARFSNFGNEVDYCAPGVRILSTHKEGRYAYLSGTSMAAPHVAGLLLLNGGKLRTDGYVRNDPDGTPDPIAHR
ncbi:MAG: S8 family serine peptidase [Ferruginibacter sp.]|nr:S8 family serine peptidase [Cytophagales bacterium]